ncbi:venom C-type lectin mannose binding isoform 3 [Aphelenchoides avenae]|nr:venom C-type lectin mannose binding isoform 3 [Aphelenchus avenae]
MAYDKTFDEAHTICLEYGAHLASMHSVEENNLLKSFAARHIDVDATAWVGLYAPKMDCRFEWSDGSALDYTNWYPGRPMCNGGNPWYCVTMITDISGKDWPETVITNIYDDICSLRHHAICQKSPTYV